MLAQRASTFRLIGAGVTSVGALAAIFGSGGSNAQTLANLDTDRAAYQESKCGHILDEARKVGCRGQASIDFDNARTAVATAKAAAARQRTEAARKSIAENQKAIAKSDAAIADHRKATAEHQIAGESARVRAQCLNIIADALTANPPRITVAEARVAKTTPTPSDDPCVWRERLAPRLGALTKQ